MLHLLADTCIWLDIAKSINGEQLIAAVRVLVHQKQLELLVPGQVISEFERNRERVESAMTRSISADLREVRATIERHGRARGRKAALDLLDDISHRVPLMNQMATRHLDEILELLRAGRSLEATPEVKETVLERALAKRAPFHHGRNSTADALIFELYAQSVAEVAGVASDANVTFCFVTANTKDFSESNGDTRKPHPDLAAAFGETSLYFTGLGAALVACFPEEGEELLDELDFHEEPRRLDEIDPVLDKLFDQIWYNRHKNREYRIETGETPLVDDTADHDPQRTVIRSVWERAKAAAREVEAKRGLDDLGPWDDFEWGMLNGKLSALRWVLGEDWESSLDT